MFHAVLGGIAMDCRLKMKLKKHLVCQERLPLKSLESPASMKNAATLFFAIRKSGKRLSIEWGAGSILIIPIARWIYLLWRSVWWVFKQLYEKGLVYEGFKVMPFSAKLGTPFPILKRAKIIKMSMILP